MKTRRVGTLTAGLALVATGVLFLLRTLAPGLIDIETALGFWPVVLILLGIEVLCAAFADPARVELKYDFISVLLMLLCLAGAFACGFMQYFCTRI